MTRILILSFSLFFSMLTVNADSSCEKNSITIQKFFGSKKKMGQGTVYKFIFPAYDISLWSKEKKWNYQTLFALEVKARWDSSKEEMLESTIEVMKRNTELTDDQEKEYTELLNSFYPDLKEGDLITVVYVPDQKIFFYHNNNLLKAPEDMFFARAFCDIWLAPKTKYKSAREAILGLS
ncbi:chalcone isomerase family protein [Alphaproteobacteria bacterium]|nr:chalcone isomerase family protein [Alphaproteobacteria bacterium]